MSKLPITAALGSVLVVLSLPGLAQPVPPPLPPSLPNPIRVPETPVQTSLNVGAVGASVESLQRALLRNGFDPGPIDGVYGSLTLSAVQLFQQERNLPVDGVAGPDTLRALGLSDGRDRVATADAAPSSLSEQRANLPYVAAITESRGKLPRVQQSFGNATLDSARQGDFINIGSYNRYSAASNRVREARRLGFDARILYKP